MSGRQAWESAQNNFAGLAENVVGLVSEGVLSREAEERQILRSLLNTRVSEQIR